jgi:hypothetical protein
MSRILVFSSTKKTVQSRCYAPKIMPETGANPTIFEFTATTPAFLKVEVVFKTR